MGSLVYLLGHSAKNSIKDTLHKPGKLILYLFMIALFGFFIINSILSPHQTASAVSTTWMDAVFFAFLAFILVQNVLMALSTGRSIFSMSDVDHLFVSPLNPRTIMLYGLVRQMGFSLLSGIFILAWAPLLSSAGVGMEGVLGLLLIYALCIVIQSIMSMFIYNLTNGKPRRKLLVKLLLVLVFIPAVVYFIVNFVGGTEPLAALEQTMNSLFVKAIPIAGWAATGMAAVMQGQWLAAILWLGLLILSGVGMVLFLMFGKVDYYEDVLVATETNYERKRAQEEGNMQESMAADSKVRVRKTGLNGSGASVLFYKHLRETFRENRFGFFGVSTIVRMVLMIGLAIIFSDQTDMLIFLLMAFMWMQCIMIGYGRGLRELYAHYIYLIPESSMKKELWSNMETVLQTLLEGALFFTIPGIIMKSHPLVIVGAIVTYTLFSLVLVGINYLSMRWTQTSLSSPIMLVVYLLALLLLMAPGIVAAVLIGSAIGSAVGTALGLFALSAWEVLVALGCFALSRNILNRCDMPAATIGGANRRR